MNKQSKLLFHLHTDKREEGEKIILLILHLNLLAGQQHSAALCLSQGLEKIWEKLIRCKLQSACLVYMDRQGKMMRCFRGNKDEIERERALMRNGGMLLEKSIAINNGRGNPIRSFSIQEINNAINNYDPNQRFVIVRDGIYEMYKRFLQDRPVIVKKYDNNEILLEGSINEIVFASQMSAHKNVLKLLGCCLESPIPILVFEHAEMGILDHYIFKYVEDLRPLSWKNRLKIAVDVANVIAYLHTAFPRPIVHRGINPRNILLDEDYRAKLSDFSSSISIPEGKTHIVTEPLIGTRGYVAPEYFFEGKFSEQLDVFSFGVLMLELLTGKRTFEPLDYGHLDLPFVEIFEKCMEENEKLDKLMDPIIIEEGTWSGKEQQLKAYARLALQCMCERSENRPEITEVGKQLRQIYQSLISSC
ncbi:serine/threonine-protein kinase ZRK1-like isoform X2 [Hevea brasiliensis]|uniref:serine/threonine-protein kinase ZRK1-like isoform X2 n=1 Tax=Hevea brasiliensis TaxID=3981 RepID=UPI0025D320E1|nr:serine/threonine-protein kinase ZRK1-like isoform X2 [Hevea brasiliensis]